MKNLIIKYHVFMYEWFSNVALNGNSMFIRSFHHKALKHAEKVKKLRVKIYEAEK
jgi:hypothetical protein